MTSSAGESLDHRGQHVGYIEMTPASASTRHPHSSSLSSLLSSSPRVSVVSRVGHSVPDLHPDRGIAPLCSTYHLHIDTAALAYCRLLVCLLTSFAHPPTSPLIPVLRA